MEYGGGKAIVLSDVPKSGLIQAPTQWSRPWPYISLSHITRQEDMRVGRGSSMKTGYDKGGGE